MSNMQQQYQTLLANDKIKPDANQATLVEELSRLQDDILAYYLQPVWRRRLSIWQKAPKGLYVYGSVGIGKTLLMDLFYQSLDLPTKSRWHFHAFMRHIHHQLSSYQGKVSPLKWIAKQLANETEVICFDEFFVNDITDAMILGQLLKYCLELSICFVFTSNCEPDKLYWRGVQRESFLPAITLIKSTFTICHIASNQDYRLQALQKNGTFFQGNTSVTNERLQQLFAHLSPNYDASLKHISINQRPIKVQQVSHHVVWFDFEQICQTPRNTNDYLDIIKLYQIIFISNLRPLPAKAYDRIRYLMNFVDVLYDNRIKVIISASCSIQQIYPQGPLRQEFSRTESRLLAMQTSAYLQESEQANKQG